MYNEINEHIDKFMNESITKVHEVHTWTNTNHTHIYIYIYIYVAEEKQRFTRETQNLKQLGTPCPYTGFRIHAASASATCARSCPCVHRPWIEPCLLDPRHGAPPSGPGLESNVEFVTCSIKFWFCTCAIKRQFIIAGLHLLDVPTQPIRSLEGGVLHSLHSFQNLESARRLGRHLCKIGRNCERIQPTKATGRNMS